MTQNNYTYNYRLENISKTSLFREAMWGISENEKPKYTYYNITKKLSLIDSKKPSSVEEADDIERFKNSLNKKVNFSEIIQFSEFEYPDAKRNIFQRLNSLNTMFESEENESPSLDSLRGLLTFLYSIKSFRKPIITLNDSGYFQLNWKRDKNNLLTLNFKEKFFLHYVIFMPSAYTRKRIILNGSMNIFDFKRYLSKLGIKLHLEGK